MKFLSHRIADTRMLRLIKKWLNAGVIEANEWSKSEQGTPQGALCKALHKPPYAKQVLMQSNLNNLLILNKPL